MFFSRRLLFHKKRINALPFSCYSFLYYFNLLFDYFSSSEYSILSWHHGILSSVISLVTIFEKNYYPFSEYEISMMALLCRLSSHYASTNGNQYLFIWITKIEISYQRATTRLIVSVLIHCNVKALLYSFMDVKWEWLHSVED